MNIYFGCWSDAVSRTRWVVPLSSGFKVIELVHWSLSMHRHIQPSRYDRRETHLALSRGQETSCRGVPATLLNSCVRKNACVNSLRNYCPLANVTSSINDYIMISKYTWSLYLIHEVFMLKTWMIDASRMMNQWYSRSRTKRVKSYFWRSIR